MSLTKDINGNRSSKRVAGLVAGAVVLIAFVADGFHFYDLNESVANTIILAVAGMLGIGTFEKKQPG
jgi:hypothetical protein